MNILKVFSLSIICLLLFGCAQTIPTYDTGKGLVAFPYSFSNSTITSSLQTYEFISSTDDRFSVKIVFGNYPQDVSLSDPIDEGQYTVDTIIIRSVTREKIEARMHKKEYNIEVPFVINVYDGEISLIPFVFEIKQYQQMDQIFLENKITKFDDELEKLYYERLNKKENINQWRIRTL